MHRRLTLLLALAVLFTATTAQIPDTFKNLEILPKDIQKRDLVKIMREMSGATGLRCNGCHVAGSDPSSLTGMDFASDEMERKRVARVMIQMTHEINHELLPETGRKEMIQVRCVTCHRGVPKPEQLDHILLAEADTAGVPAAEAKYRKLREMFYGSAAYDFTQRTIDRVAETLAQEKQDLDGAIVIARMGAEWYPDSARSHLSLAQLLITKGEKAEAVKSIERALALDPENEHAKEMLEEAKSGK